MIRWGERNSNVTRDLNRASDKCSTAWGWGGDDADGDMSACVFVVLKEWLTREAAVGELV